MSSSSIAVKVVPVLENEKARDFSLAKGLFESTIAIIAELKLDSEVILHTSFKEHKVNDSLTEITREVSLINDAFTHQDVIISEKLASKIVTSVFEEKDRQPKEITEQIYFDTNITIADINNFIYMNSFLVAVVPEIKKFIFLLRNDIDKKDIDAYYLCELIYRVTKIKVCKEMLGSKQYSKNNN